jgi:hypothetical protein
MAKQLGDLTEASALSAVDLLLVRNSAGIDQKILFNNLIKSSRVTVAKSFNFSVLNTDVNSVFLITTGATDRTAALQAAAENENKIYTFIKADSGIGKVIVEPQGSELVNGTLNWEITDQYGYVVIISDGVGWWVLANEGTVYEDIVTTGTPAQTNPVSGTWYNVGSQSLTVPAGVYMVEYSQYAVRQHGTAQAIINLAVTLSKTAGAEDDFNFTQNFTFSNPGTNFSTTVSFGQMYQKKLKQILTAATTFYINLKTTSDGGQGSIFKTNLASQIIRATRIG